MLEKLGIFSGKFCLAKFEIIVPPQFVEIIEINPLISFED